MVHTRDWPTVEAALRWMAARRAHEPFRILEMAITHPVSRSAEALAVFVEATASLPDGTPQTRALAALGLIIKEIDKLAPDPNSRRRNALYAAFRLPRRPETTQPWGSTLTERFEQLRPLRAVFGSPTTVNPMAKAWDQGARELTPALAESLGELALHGESWLPYVTVGHQIRQELAAQGPAAAGPLEPTTVPPGAQPVYFHRMVWTFVMARRTVATRTIESWVKATEDIDHYFVRVGLPIETPDSPPLADKHTATQQRIGDVKGMLNCKVGEARRIEGGKKLEVQIDFPHTVKKGMTFFWATQVTRPTGDDEQPIVELQVWSAGIAPGVVRDDMPLSGLTMRIQFDQDTYPAAAWWFAECIDDLRLDKPPDGDLRRIEKNLTAHGYLEHTFTHACKPREKYGIGWEW